MLSSKTTCIFNVIWWYTLGANFPTLFPPRSIRVGRLESFELENIYIDDSFIVRWNETVVFYRSIQEFFVVCFWTWLSCLWYYLLINISVCCEDDEWNVTVVLKCLEIALLLYISILIGLNVSFLILWYDAKLYEIYVRSFENFRKAHFLQSTAIFSYKKCRANFHKGWS